MSEKISESTEKEICNNNLLKVWEKTIDMQMHFNKMCMRLRHAALSILSALLAATAIAIRLEGLIQTGSSQIPVASIFIYVAIIILLSFYLMDRFWYHLLLRGSVEYAKYLGEEAKKSGLNFKLNVSEVIEKKNKGRLNLSGAKKINFFYGTLIIMLFAILKFFL